MELKYRDKATLQSNVELTFPKISNHKLCGDYLLSRTLTRTKKNRVTIEDDINRNATIENHFALKKLLDAEQRLKDRKELAITQREDLDKQWEDLKSKEDSLREKFIFFSKFVHENIEKRDRAKLKIANMKELRRKRLQQIQEVSSDCQQMQEMKKHMDENIHKMKIYEDFLAQVVEMFPNKFSDVVDILRRYGALIDARTELKRMQERDMHRLERARNNFDGLIADKYVKIAVLKTELCDMEKRHEIARATCRKWENFHHAVALETQKKLVETEAVKVACWQIYKDICDRKGVPAVYEDDYLRQFETIKKDLLQRRLVNDKMAALEAEKLRLSVKACASSG